MINSFPTFIFLCTISLAFMAVAPDALAQDAPPPRSPPVPEATERAAAMKSAREPRQFQSSGTAGSRMTFGHLAESPGLHVTQDIFSLLQYDRIHRALELSPDQLAKVAETEIENIRSRQEMMRNLAKSAAPVQSPDAAKTRRQAQEKLLALKEQRFIAILTREQLVRLQQIAIELRIQSSGAYAILSDPQMVAELDLSARQLADLRQSAGEQSIELNKKLMELKREIRTELISVLDENQKLQLQSMLGKPFEWRDDQGE